MERNIIVPFIPHLIANPKSDATRSPVTLPETTLQPRFQASEPGQTSPPGIVKKARLQQAWWEPLYPCKGADLV